MIIDEASDATPEKMDYALDRSVAGLVERLNGENPDKVVATDRLRMFAHDPATFVFDQHDALSLIPTIEEAVSLIQSQAARIADLEALPPRVRDVFGRPAPKEAESR